MVVVRRLDAHARLDRDADRLPDGKARLFLDIFFQRDPFHELHHDIINPVVLANVVNVDDIGMHQARCRLRLHPEFGNKIRVFGKLLLQHLHCHMAV